MCMTNITDNVNTEYISEKTSSVKNFSEKSKSNLREMCLTRVKWIAKEEAARLHERAMRVESDSSLRSRAVD